jgi:hypothetical protein
MFEFKCFSALRAPYDARRLALRVRHHIESHRALSAGVASCGLGGLAACDPD